MLFELDKSIRSIFEAKGNPKRDSSLHALELIASSYRRGIHLIDADKDLLKFLSLFEESSQITRGIFTKLYNDYPEYCYKELLNIYKG